MDYYAISYILLGLGVIITLIASAKVKTTFKKYSRVGASCGMTSEQVAAKMLHDAGIYDVRIERIGGNLTDHYSPKEKVLRLSDTVYGSNSVAAIGVAAHECGHAIQHNEEYGPLRIRSVSVPVANIGSKLSWPVILVGLFLTGKSAYELGNTVINIGILLFVAVIFFQLITLPVEFDASKRALATLKTDGILVESEHDSAKKVLSAAAMTYVAALFTTVLQFIRILLMVSARGGGKRRNSR